MISSLTGSCKWNYFKSHTGFKGDIRRSQVWVTLNLLGFSSIRNLNVNKAASMTRGEQPDNQNELPPPFTSIILPCIVFTLADPLVVWGLWESFAFRCPNQEEVMNLSIFSQHRSCANICNENFTSCFS